MEPKFQTSFIPKKQAYPSIGGVSGGFVQKPKIGFGTIFMAFAVIAFIISLGGLAGAYFWKAYLTKTNNAYVTELASHENSFELASISDLKRVNFQIDNAKKVLANHVAMSKIFNFLGKLTIEKVRFTSLDVKGSDGKGNVTVNMSGYGTSLETVAYQSDVLDQLSNLAGLTNVTNTSLTSPSQQPDGTVSFAFSGEIDPKTLLYVDPAANANAVAPATTTTP